MATKVFTKLVKKTTTVINVRYSTFNGRIPVTRMPIAVITLEMRYHFLTERVVSTKGAQTNLNILGNNVTAIRGATCSNGTPAFVNRNPIVTLTYPPITPNGRNKNIKTLGCGCFCNELELNILLKFIYQFPLANFKSICIKGI